MISSLFFVLLYIFMFLVHISNYSALCHCYLCFSNYCWTAFTNKSSKCFQTLFSQHLPVRVTVNGFTVRGAGGLLTLCGLLTCCRPWPVECPADPGMWRPFGCKAHRINRADGRGFSLRANAGVLWVTLKVWWLFKSLFRTFKQRKRLQSIQLWRNDGTEPSP